MSESVAESPLGTVRSAASTRTAQTTKTSPMPETHASRRNGIFLWAILGVTLLLGQAMFRLSQIAWEALSSGLMSNSQIAICAAWTISNIYLEGYRGFHTRFVPRVIARAHHLALHPRQPAVIFAPLFAMAFFHSNRRAKAAAWGVSLAVIIAIVYVRTLPQPWRGIIDAGVVAGLLFGTLSLLWSALGRLRGNNPTSSPDLPH